MAMQLNKWYYLISHDVSFILFHSCFLSSPIFQLPKESPFFFPLVHATYKYLLICSHGAALHLTEK